MTDNDRSKLDQELVEIDEDPNITEDANHTQVSCSFCPLDHTAKIVQSPPEGFKAKYYCTDTERRGRKSLP